MVGLRDTQDASSLTGYDRIDLKLVLYAQGLQLLGVQRPPLTGHSLGADPVDVRTHARLNNRRSWQFGRLAERLEGYQPFVQIRKGLTKSAV